MGKMVEWGGWLDHGVVMDGSLGDDGWIRKMVGLGRWLDVEDGFIPWLCVDYMIQQGV